MLSRKLAPALSRRVRVKSLPISAWWVVTRNMQFGPHVFLCLFQTASIPQRPFASRLPILQPSRCLHGIVAYFPGRRSSLSARQAPSVQRCSISRVILASKQSGHAQRRTSLQLSDLVPRQSTIGLVTLLPLYVSSRRDELAAPASMRHSMRSADPISTGRSPVSRQGASSSATAPRRWQSGAKA